MTNTSAEEKKSSIKWKWVGAGCSGCLVVLIVFFVSFFLYYRQYIREMKASEAQANIGMMITGYQSACEYEDVSGLQAGPLPATPGSSEQFANFQDDPGFALIVFDPGPVRFRYSIENTSLGVLLVAEGDLDDDGVLSRYSVACNGCECGPREVENPLE